MTLAQQILWGSGFLSICLILQVGCLGVCAQMLERLNVYFHHTHLPVRLVTMLSLSLVGMVFALTVQVWLWSLVYYRLDIIPDWNASLYFSIVTFTTLGYGDIVLGPDLRIFASFGAVTGLLSFGLSTAFLVAVTTAIFDTLNWPHKIGENKRDRGAP